MEHLLNLTDLKKKMKNQPTAQKLNGFFDGAKSYLENEQKDDLIEIITNDFNQVIEYIKSSKSDV